MPEVLFISNPVAVVWGVDSRWKGPPSKPYVDQTHQPVIQLLTLQCENHLNLKTPFKSIVCASSPCETIYILVCSFVDKFTASRIVFQKDGKN